MLPARRYLQLASRFSAQKAYNHVVAHERPGGLNAVIQNIDIADQQSQGNEGKLNQGFGRDQSNTTRKVLCRSKV